MVNKVSRFSSIKRATCFCFSKDEQPDKTSKEYNKKTKKRSNGHKSFIPIFNEPSSIEKILEDAERHTLLVNPPPPPPSSSQEIAPPSPKFPFPKTTSSTSSSSRIAASVTKIQVSNNKGYVDDQVSPKVVSSSSVTKIQVPNNKGYVDDQVSPKLVSSSSVTKIQVPNNKGYVDDQVSPKVVSSSSVTKIQVPNNKGYVDDQVSPKVVSSSIKKNQVANKGYVDDQVIPKVVSSSVTTIQAAYRGHVARRGYKALKGLVRLQGVTKRESVKRQIMNAMKTMQSFSKLQTEIRLLRIQILESKALQRQTQLIEDDDDDNNNNNESVQASTISLSKQPAQSNDWDDSVLSKHDRESRQQRKQEAILLKKKAMSYAAYTQQQQHHHHLSPHPNSHLPWWWNWIDHKLPLLVVPTNKSSDPPPLLKTDPKRASPMRYYYPRSRPSSSSAGAHKFSPFPFNEDSNSLVSCPAFSSPHSHSQRHYMEQTASALAKVRPKSNPRQRMIPGRSRSPGTESSRRFSFPTTPISSGSSKFKRESFEKQGYDAIHHKVEQLSTGSPTSVTSRNILDRKPFNRFV